MIILDLEKVISFNNFGLTFTIYEKINFEFLDRGWEDKRARGGEKTNSLNVYSTWQVLTAEEKDNFEFYDEASTRNLPPQDCKPNANSFTTFFDRGI